jgi:hypothetical protein
MYKWPSYANPLNCDDAGLQFVQSRAWLKAARFLERDGIDSPGVQAVLPLSHPSGTHWDELWPGGRGILAHHRKALAVALRVAFPSENLTHLTKCGPCLCLVRYYRLLILTYIQITPNERDSV